MLSLAHRCGPYTYKLSPLGDGTYNIDVVGTDPQCGKEAEKVTKPSNCPSGPHGSHPRATDVTPPNATVLFRTSLLLQQHPVRKLQRVWSPSHNAIVQTMEVSV